MLFYSPYTEITAYAVSRFVDRIRGDSPVQRRLEDKIKALAEHAVTVQDPEELGDVIDEQQLTQLRDTLGQALVGKRLSAASIAVAACCGNC